MFFDDTLDCILNWWQYKKQYNVESISRINYSRDSYVRGERDHPPMDRITPFLYITFLPVYYLPFCLLFSFLALTLLAAYHPLLSNIFFLYVFLSVPLFPVFFTPHVVYYFFCYLLLSFLSLSILPHPYLSWASTLLTTHEEGGAD